MHKRQRRAHDLSTADYGRPESAGVSASAFGARDETSHGASDQARAFHGLYLRDHARTQEGTSTNNNETSRAPVAGLSRAPPQAAAAPEIIIDSAVWAPAEIFNPNNLLHVKEKRPFGATRGNTSVPQVPALVVRIKAEGIGRTENLAVRAMLWSCGPITQQARFIEKKGIHTLAPKHGEPFCSLRGNAKIECQRNVAFFGPVEADGNRRATLRCVFSRAARIPCKRNYISLKLDCVHVDLPSSWHARRRADVEIAQSQTADGAAQSMLPPPSLSFPLHPAEFPDPSRVIVTPFREVPGILTRRLSISEKAMCPRACDMSRKRQTPLDPSVSPALANTASSSSSSSSASSSSLSSSPDFDSELVSSNPAASLATLAESQTQSEHFSLPLSKRPEDPSTPIASSAGLPNVLDATPFSNPSTDAQLFLRLQQLQQQLQQQQQLEHHQHQHKQQHEERILEQQLASLHQHQMQLVHMQNHQARCQTQQSVAGTRTDSVFAEGLRKLGLLRDSPPRSKSPPTVSVTAAASSGANATSSNGTRAVLRPDSSSSSSSSSVSNTVPATPSDLPSRLLQDLRNTNEGKAIAAKYDLSKLFGKADAHQHRQQQQQQNQITDEGFATVHRNDLWQMNASQFCPATGPRTTGSMPFPQPPPFSSLPPSSSSNAALRNLIASSSSSVSASLPVHPGQDHGTLGSAGSSLAGERQSEHHQHTRPSK